MIEVKYNKEKNTIKIWPYLDDITQAIIPYTDTHLSKASNMVINLDFSSVKSINSAGATITLVKLIDLFKNRGSLYKLVFPKKEDDTYIEDYLQKSSFLNLLDEKTNFEKINLFDKIEINRIPESYIVFDEKQNIKRTSLPIFHLKYNKDCDREIVEDFSDWIADIFIKYLSKYKIKINVLLTIINEIAKNTQDHTMNDAYCGVDIIENLNSNTGTILFSCADLGIGIYQNVKGYIKHNPTHLKDTTHGHLSYTDAYKFAFTMGSTTSKKPRNKGIGMSMIRDGASILNMDLSIWDARSILLVPKRISHTELRKNAFDTGNKVGFYFYGKLNF